MTAPTTIGKTVAPTSVAARETVIRRRVFVDSIIVASWWCVDARRHVARSGAQGMPVDRIVTRAGERADSSGSRCRRRNRYLTVWTSSAVSFRADDGWVPVPGAAEE